MADSGVIARLHAARLFTYARCIVTVLWYCDSLRHHNRSPAGNCLLLFSYAMRLNTTACHPELREGSVTQTTDSSQARNDRCTTIQPQLVSVDNAGSLVKLVPLDIRIHPSSSKKRLLPRLRSTALYSNICVTIAAVCSCRCKTSARRCLGADDGATN